MNAKYWQKGEVIDYKNEGSTTIDLGNVVMLGERIGISGDVIQPDKTGTVHVSGVFVMAKDSTAIDLGADVFYDETGDAVTTTGTVPIGWAIEAATGTDTEVKVKIG